MSGRKLSGSQRRKRKVAIDNEAKKSSHLMERIFKKAKTDDESSELHNFSDGSSEDDANQHEPKVLD